MAPDHSPRLPLRVRPHPDESLPGLLVRMTEANASGTPQRLLEVCGLGRATLTSVATDPKAVAPLARLLGLPEGVLAGLAYAAPDGSGRLLRHEVHQEFVTADLIRVCPRCLAEAPYHRAVWGMSLMTVCPIHAVRLIDRCPGCGKRIGWRRQWVTRCRCGADLSRAEATPVSADELAGATALHRLLHTPPDRLDGLAAEIGVGGLLRLVYGLGCIATGATLRSKPLSFAVGHPDAAWRLLEVGWQACSNWPQSFHAFLGTLRTQAEGRRGRYGLAKHFGGLPLWLNLNARHDFGRIALDAFTDYVARSSDLATRAPGVRRRRTDETVPDRCVTITDACRTLGVSFRLLRPYAERHGLVVAGSGLDGHPVLLRAAVVRRLRHDLRALVDATEGRALLGVGKRTFAELQRAGLLPDPATGLAAELRGSATWRREELRAFVRSLAARAARRRTDGRLVPLPTAARMLSRVEGGLAAVLEAIMDGRLRPVRITGAGEGLRRLAVRGAEVEALRRTMGREVRRTLSVSEAAEILGVKVEVAYQWVRRGLLPTVGARDRRTEAGRRVREEDVRAFRREYVTAPELRGRHGLGTSKKLALRLIDMGAVAVSGPSVDGARQFLFRRAEVDALLLRRRCLRSHMGGGNG